MQSVATAFRTKHSGIQEGCQHLLPEQYSQSSLMQWLGLQGAA